MNANYLKTLLLAAFVGLGAINSFADDEETTTTINYVSTIINADDASKQDLTYTFKSSDITAGSLTYDSSSDPVGTVHNGTFDDDGNAKYVNLYASTTSGLDQIAYSHAVTANSGQGFWWRSSSYGIVMRDAGSCGFAVTNLKEGDVVNLVGRRFTEDGHAVFYGAASIDGVAQEKTYKGEGEADYTVTSTTSGVKVSVSSDGYVAFYSVGGSNSNYPISSITITQAADAEKFPYTYTVKYVDASGTELKDSKTCYSASTGVTVSASDEEKATFNDSEGNFYVYTETGSTESITLSGSDDVITLVFEKSTHMWEINAVDESGNKITNLTTVYNNDDTYAYSGLSQVISVDGIYYELSDESVSSYSKTFTYTEGTFSVTYKANSDIVYFEDFSGTEATDASGGAYYSYSYAKSITSTSVSSGYYKASVNIYKVNSSRGVRINLDGTIVGSKKSGTGVQDFYVNVVGESGTISLGGGNDNGAGDYVDYIIIYEVSDYTDPIEVSSLGIVSFSAPVDVEVPSGVTVYSATLNDAQDELTLESVSTTVIPRNTGVILQAKEGTYTFNQTTETASEITTDLKATSATSSASTTLTAATTDDDGTTTTYYVLTNSNDEAVFGKVSADITLTNKAYLALTSTSSSAKSIKITMANSGATGIETINSKSADAGAYYNLQGVKVQNPQKGLYIRDGKKVIIK